MKKRTNPKQQVLEVEWSTERWVPRIQLRPESRQEVVIQALYDPFSFVPSRRRKRQQPVPVVWVRSGNRTSWR